ncbi:MAG: MASE1 domain-containing protein, partial [Gammaproteobacteria bacterium]
MKPSAESRATARGMTLPVAAGFVALYVLVAWLSYARPALKPEITPWNPQAGLTLAFLLIYGPRWWPVAVLAALLSELLVSSANVAVPTALLACFWIGLVYGALATALRRLGLTGRIESALEAGRMAGAAVVGAFVAAVGYLGLYVAVGDVPLADAMRGLARYGLADLNGILMLTPLLIHVKDWRESLQVLRSHWREMIAQCALVLAALIVVFYLPAADQLRFFYLLFVPIIWIALRWQLPGAIFAVLAIQVGLIVAARAEIHTPRFIDLQVLLLTLSLTALLLGAVVTERAAFLRRVERQEAEQRALLAMRREAEEKLRERDAELARAMRYAVAGELASALTHELNQPITALVSYLRASEIMASRHSHADERLRETLGKSVNEAMRASEVMRKLRDFYRGGPHKRESIRLQALGAGVVSSFQESLRRAGASLTESIGADVPELEGDATQLEIVLHNLIANAIDAVSRAPAAARRIELRAEHTASDVTLLVEDSGPGVSAEVARGLFEPFVTTRPDGMGLGLALSRTLVRSRGGELTFGRSSTLGGASFKLRLPIEAPAIANSPGPY